MKYLSFLAILLLSLCVHSQDYFYKKYAPFDPNIPSPEQFLGYEIGEHHTRHDQIVAYLQKLADISDKASLTTYGKTYEYRSLIILNISTPEKLKNIGEHQRKHLELVNPNSTVSDFDDLPLFINLGYNVHGNEPSSSEAAMLTAYTLVASQNEKVKKYLEESIIFIDPTINPDGRDRFSHWANMYKGNPKVADPEDVEHNEAWPYGRTNHYWFDLNRDWLLGIHPESRGKLTWYHQWYPNVVTDFHEMGTNSTYFFEPMKTNGSKNPIMPKDNYIKLNDTFAKYFSNDLDEIGSLYFTKEVFDGTYPGYGSSYPDLQGGLGILFEQASSRGHIQETNMGEITFAFTIRNQYTSSLATIRAAVENKNMLFDYQKEFFKSAITNANKSNIKGYVFGDPYDENRMRAFMDKLLLHKIKVYPLAGNVTKNGKVYKSNNSYYVPTSQPQYRMVQTMFETYNEYTDSVYYDASAWSVANFYNMSYAAVTSSIPLGAEVTIENIETKSLKVEKTNYVYIIPWEDYNAPAALYYLQDNGVRVMTAFKPFSIPTVEATTIRDFSYGTLLIPVTKQKISKDSLFNLMQRVSENFKLEVLSTNTGYSKAGVDLGSRNFKALKKPKALMLIGQGVSSYEAGEVWHLLDTRVGMPITKLPLRNFNQIDLHNYSVLTMVSGVYSQLDTVAQLRIRDWVKAGNTLITIRNATSWAVKQKMVIEKLIEENKDEEDEKSPERIPYVNASENIGKERVGGVILEVDLDLTHPLAFGYRNQKIPVYRNSSVWLAPSKNSYATVAKYTNDPHIDGFITNRNLNEFLKPSASLIVSPLGGGRVVMFADNPNFRGSWYGTNRLFLNAIFLGQHIQVPSESK